MLSSKECFKGGRVDRDALKLFIKDIKKNTKLSDEDAAVIAASKVNYNINSANTLYPGNIYIYYPPFVFTRLIKYSIH